VIVAVLAYFAQSLARFIPYHYETQIANQYRAMYPPRTEVTEYLQQLVDHLAIAQELPADMRLTVHYVDKDTINAFATVGGHIVVFRGLLEKMPNENALAMVLAHEIAHVKHRHPIQALGRGVVVGLALSIVTGATGNQSLGSVLGDAGLLTILSFNRAQEEEADLTALVTLDRYYGHVAGADTFFEIVEQLPQRAGKENIPTFLSTHPLSHKRIERLHAIAQKNGWAFDRAVVPLPDAVLASLAPVPQSE
jgi:predicted Zn-dependent protease